MHLFILSLNLTIIQVSLTSSNKAQLERKKLDEQTNCQHLYFPTMKYLSLEAYSTMSTTLAMLP